MKLVREPLEIKAVETVTHDKSKCVRLLKMGYIYKWISGNTYCLIKHFK